MPGYAWVLSLLAPDPSDSEAWDRLVAISEADACGAVALDLKTST